MTTGKWCHIEWHTIPNSKMADGLQRYLDTGRKPGQFLMALLENKFTDVFARADVTNSGLLQEWAWWMHREFPSVAWGDPATVKAWSEKMQAEVSNDKD